MQVRGLELDSARQSGMLRVVQQRLSLSQQKIGLPTIAAALAALSMAVLGHFFI